MKDNQQKTNDDSSKASAYSVGKGKGIFARSLLKSKITIGAVNYPREPKADVMADKVLRKPEQPPQPQFFFNPYTSNININEHHAVKEELQRKEDKEEYMEETLPDMQTKLAFDALTLPPPDDKNDNNTNDFIQCKCAACEQEEKEQYLHRKENHSGTTDVNSGFENYISNLDNYGSPLPQEAKTFFEPKFGYDFSNVKVHTDAIAAKSADSINALAYTSGNNIVFNQRQFSPETDNGRKLLAHELTHVVQQSEGTSTSKEDTNIQCSGQKNTNKMGITPVSSSKNPGTIQRLELGDVVDFLEWTNPLTFSGKAFQSISGVELSPLLLVEQAIKASASRITIPAKHIADLTRYANAVPSDGAILYNAIAQSPSYYQGGLLLRIQGDAEAMTFGNSIFFNSNPPDVSTFIHEMVHIYQFNKVGRSAFLASYYGVMPAMFIYRWYKNLPFDTMKSSPYENEAYDLETRFKVWLAKNP